MPAAPSVLHPGDLVRIRGQRWRIVRHVSYGVSAIAEVAGCDGTNHGERARFLLPFEPCDREDEARAPRVVRPARWRRHARDVVSRAAPGADALRADVAAGTSILPFQLEPALAVIRGLGCRLLIADEVGLGKTVQAGLIITDVLARQPDARALVVAPAGLREQWQQEVETRFRLRPVVLEAAALAEAATLAPPGVNPWAAHAVVIVSIDYVKRPEVLRAIESVVWDVAVFDEAHALAGRSDRAAAAVLLAERARTVVLLSATPHDGDDEAFARLCGIGDLQRRFPLLLFRRTRRETGQPLTRRTAWLRVRPTPGERAMHEALLAYGRLVWTQAGPSGHGARLAMSVLARRACSSAASLARSVERRLHLLDAAGDAGQSWQPLLPLDAIPAGDEAPAAELAAPGLRDRHDERRRLQRVLDLARQAAGRESKLGAIGRLLRRTRETAIVFTEYRDTLARIASNLAEIEVALLHGGLTRAERAAALHRFTSGGARVLLATDAASEGLNLHQRCRLIVHLELPWTPLRLEQRVGRVERIGQERRVHAVHLVAAGTSEDTVVARLLGRLARVEAALGEIRAAGARQDDIPGAVLGDAPLPDAEGAVPPPAPPRPALPPGVVVPDLRALAAREAERLIAARRLRDGARPPAAAGRGSDVSGAPYRLEPRAVMTSIRRRRRETCCYWTFRVGITDADGHILHEHLVALRARAAARPPFDPERLRRLLQVAPLAHALDQERAAVLAACRAALAAPLALGLERERALAAAIADRHARLSAALLQQGLFDRRAERTAAAQATIRDEALTRCAARIRGLTLAAAPDAGPCDLVFAVAIG